MYRRFEGEFVEEENEIKQPNAGQESAAWFPLFLLEVYANYDVSNEPGYRAPAEKKKKKQPATTTTTTTKHISPYVSFPHLWIDQGFQLCVCGVSDISSHIIQIWGERNLKEIYRMEGTLFRLYSSKCQHETVKSTWVTTTVASRERERHTHKRESEKGPPLYLPPIHLFLLLLLLPFFGKIKSSAAGTIRGYQKGLGSDSDDYTYTLQPRRAQCLARSLRFQVAPCPMICCQTGTIYDRQRALFYSSAPFPSHPMSMPNRRPPLFLFLLLHSPFWKCAWKEAEEEEKNDINISKATIDRRAERLY